MRGPALALTLTMAVGGSSGVHAGDQQGVTWSDAYDQALRDIKACAPTLEVAPCKEWGAIETALLAARQRGPAQGARALFPGDDYREFIPDYYLGLVYLNTGRSQQAETLLKSVRDRKLVPSNPRQARARDPLVPSLERVADLERRATFERATADARQKLAAKDFSAARNALKDAVGTSVSPAAVDALQKEIDAAESLSRQPITPEPANASRGAGLPPANLPATDPPRGTATPNTGGRSDPDPGARGTTVVPSGSPGRDPETGRGPVSNRPPSDAAEQARFDQAFGSGVRAFLQGNYQAAARALEAASSSPVSTPRAKIYLACANAALVLTGRADPSLLALARTQYAAADPQRNLLPEDRRVISPGILERLR